MSLDFQHMDLAKNFLLHMPASHFLKQAASWYDRDPWRGIKL